MRKITTACVFCCWAFVAGGAWAAAPVDTTYTTYQAAKKIQKKYPFAAVHVADTTGLMIVRDVEYTAFVDSSGARRSLRLDLFAPKRRGIYPAILMVHGGGWSSGSKAMEAPMASHLAREGFVCLPVEYRLTADARYPAAVYDLKNAVKWVREHAAQLGVDTTRIAIAGNSAGGQLAALVSMTHGVSIFDPQGAVSGASSRVNALIDIDGVVDFLAPGSLNLDRTKGGADVRWLGATFDQNPSRWKEASPVYWVDRGDVPVLFIASSQSRFHAGRGEMIDLLTEYNIYYESYTLPDSPHSFWLMDPWFDPTVGYISAFLRKVFRLTQSMSYR